MRWARHFPRLRRPNSGVRRRGERFESQREGHEASTERSGHVDPPGAGRPQHRNRGPSGVDGPDAASATCSCARGSRSPSTWAWACSPVRSCSWYSRPQRSPSEPMRKFSPLHGDLKSFLANDHPIQWGHSAGSVIVAAAIVVVAAQAYRAYWRGYLRRLARLLGDVDKLNRFVDALALSNQLEMVLDGAARPQEGEAPAKGAGGRAPTALQRAASREAPPRAPSEQARPRRPDRPVSPGDSTCLPTRTSARSPRCSMTRPLLRSVFGRRWGGRSWCSAVTRRTRCATSESSSGRSESSRA